jgi:hypothetical protein
VIDVIVHSVRVGGWGWGLTLSETNVFVFAAEASMLVFFQRVHDERRSVPSYHPGYRGKTDLQLWRLIGVMASLLVFFQRVHDE